MNTQQEKRLEELCIKYIPSRFLGDFLPARITIEVIGSYTRYLSRLNDSEAYGHLMLLGVPKKRAKDFVEERTKLREVKK